MREFEEKAKKAEKKGAEEREGGYKLLRKNVSRRMYIKCIYKSKM